MKFRRARIHLCRVYLELLNIFLAYEPAANSWFCKHRFQEASFYLYCDIKKSVLPFQIINRLMANHTRIYFEV